MFSLDFDILFIFLIFRWCSEYPKQVLDYFLTIMAELNQQFKPNSLHSCCQFHK